MVADLTAEDGGECEVEIRRPVSEIRPAIGVINTCAGSTARHFPVVVGIVLRVQSTSNTAAAATKAGRSRERRPMVDRPL